MTSVPLKTSGRVFPPAAANKIFASPASGPSGPMTVRDAVVADIPDLSAVYANAVTPADQEFVSVGEDGTIGPSGFDDSSFVKTVGGESPQSVVYVAGSNATAAQKAASAYVCDGTDDDVQIKQAAYALPSTGGKVGCVGDFYITDQINILGNNVTLDFSASGSVNLTGSLGSTSLVAAASKCFAFGRGAGSSCNVSIGTASVAVFQLTEEYAFDNDAPVYVGAATTLATGLSQTTQYYVINKNADAGTFSVSLTVGGAAVTISNTGSGQHYVVYAFYSYDFTTNILTVLGTSPPVFSTGMAVGLNVKGTSTTPSGLTVLPQVYYLSRIGTTNTYNPYTDPLFQVPAVATGNGTGNLLIIVPVTRDCEVIGVNLIMSSASATAGNAGGKHSRNSMDCTFRKCKVTGGRWGIRWSGYGNRVIRGWFSSQSKSGIACGTSGSNILIDGVTIIGSGEAGITSNGLTSTNLQVVNNTITLCQKQGIILNGISAVVSGNNVIGNNTTVAGYDIDVSAVAAAVVMPNTIVAGPNSIAAINPNTDTVYIDGTGRIFAPAFAGVGNGLTGLNADNIASGTVALARLTQATTSTSGYLSGTDWNTFNGKDSGGAAATVQTNLGTHAALTTAHGSTSANTASTIVQRDGSGNFSAGTISAALSGNASTVTTNANLTGPITSSGNVTSIGAQTGTGNTFVMSTAPTIAGGVHTAITSFGLRSTGAAFDLTLATSEILTAGRTLSIVLGDAARTLTFTGNASINGTNNGDQTITLTGGVTGSGTGSFAATVVTNANLTGPITSTGNATVVASQTGTGSKFVMDAGPTMSSPTFTGTATAANITIVAAAGSSLIATDTTTSTNKQVVFSGSNAIWEVWQANTAAGGPGVALKKARGTIASPTTVAASDACGAVLFYGHDGTGYLNRAAINTFVDGAVSTNNIPLALRFLTGVTSSTERGRITSSGRFLFGTTTDNGGVLQLVGSVSGAVGTSQLKMNSGVLLATPEDGAFEYDGTHYYGTVGSTRFQLDQQLSNIIHIVGASTPPTIAAGAGAGTSPTISLTGTDLAGKISLTTGTLPTGGTTVFTVTFNAGFTTAPYVAFSPANASAAALNGLTMVYVTSTTTTFVFSVGVTGLGATTSYVWNYLAIG